MTLAPSLGLQLYSGRKFPPVEAQLAIVSRHGFANVETFGPFYDDVEATKRLFDKQSVSATSGHFALAMLEGESDRAVAIAERLDMKYVVAPYLSPEERPTSVAGWKALGARLVAIETRAWRRRIARRVAQPRFRIPSARRRVAADRTCAGGSPFVEADLAWVMRADADPRRWIDRYGGRIPLVHVKDIAPAGEKRGRLGGCRERNRSVGRTLAVVRVRRRRGDDSGA